MVLCTVSYKKYRKLNKIKLHRAYYVVEKNSKAAKIIDKMLSKKLNFCLEISKEFFNANLVKNYHGYLLSNMRFFGSNLCIN